MKTNRLMVLVVIVLGFSGEIALAQISPAPAAPRAPRPTLSPYLNLLDRNNTPAFNYYNRVRPRQQFDDYRVQQYQNLSALEKRVDENRQAILQSQNSQLGPTGHRVRFMDLGGHFGTGPAGSNSLGGSNFGRP